MQIPLCGACPVADRCSFRITRPEDRQNIPEPEAGMFDLRKRDEAELTELMAKNSIVVRQGAFKILSPGQEILQIIGPSELVGVDHFYANLTEKMTAKSLMPEITVCAMPHAAFERYLYERRSLTEYVLRLMTIRSFHARYFLHWTKKSLRERAVLVLYGLCERFGVRYGQFRMVDIPLTKIDLASLMATVQESAVRVLSEFRESGLISSNGKRIVILDNARLDQMFNDLIQADRRQPSQEDEDKSSS